MSEQTDGNKWGDPIENIHEARRERLMRLEDKQQEWAEQLIGEREESPFSHEDLTGAEVFFLATYTWFDTPDKMGIAEQRLRNNVVHPNYRLHLEGAHMNGAVLNGAILAGAHLEGADLSSAYLSGSNLTAVSLTGANLNHADLSGANFQGANLNDTNLGDVNLTDARLPSATLCRAMLRNADLRGTQLFYADLSNADLRGTRMTGDTLLNACKVVGASFDQVTFGDVKLSLIEWEDVDILGDERKARGRKNEAGGTKSSISHLYEFQAAARAYRQLSVALRSQGLNEDADRNAYKGHLMQRVALRYQALQPSKMRPVSLWYRLRKMTAYVWSCVLWGLAGYGYRPGFSVLAYLLIVGVFAFAYHSFGVPTAHAAYHLSWLESVVVSLTAFHGRGFFAQQYSPGDPQSVLAAGEAVIGLLIEITFIATFTQRFFAR